MRRSRSAKTKNARRSSTRGRRTSMIPPRAPTGASIRGTISDARSMTTSSRPSANDTRVASVTAFAPATVSNVGCGFDVLGFALEAPGDKVTARAAPSGVRIDDITGDGGRLPREAARNTAGVAAQALLNALGERRGVALSVHKGLPLASGLGGSAASAAAAVVAVDALFEAHTPLEILIACALEGERLGAGSAHADNIAPAIVGGFVLVRRPNPPDIVR